MKYDTTGDKRQTWNLKSKNEKEVKLVKEVSDLQGTIWSIEIDGEWWTEGHSKKDVKEEYYNSAETGAR